MPLYIDHFRALGSILCLLAFSAGAVAEETADEVSDDFAAIRSECQENIGRLQAKLAAPESVDEDAVVALRDQLNLWRQIELVAAQRKAVAEANKLARPASTVAADVELTITSFMELEQARETLAVTRRNLESLQGELRAERSLSLETRQLLERAQQDHRRVTEELLSASAESRLTLQAQQRMEALHVRLRLQQHALHRDTIDELTRKEENTLSIISAYEDRVEVAKSKVRLSEEEVAQELERLTGMEQTVRVQLSKLDLQMHFLLSATSKQQVSAESTKLSVIREESQILRQLLTEFAAISECWQRRYRFSQQEVPTQEWLVWLEDAYQSRKRLSQIHDRLASRAMQRRQQLVALQRDPDFSGAALEDASSEIGQLEAITDAYGNLQVLARRGQRFYTRFSEDLETRQSQFSARYWASWAGNRIRSLWDYELTAVDDRSVTVGKLVTGLLLLILGMLISKQLSSIVAFRILPRFGFNVAAATTIRQIMMYGLFVAMTILSLHMVNVPLTVFAFLGGAAAIGVGFGSQNTIANFISGLILLIQRPIRIGDLVNVDGIDANVEHIGVRATRVITSENLEVLIPNHNILQNKVANWTLSDTRIRTSVSVGVAYGTRVQPVLDSLQAAVTQHAKVLSTPEPIVLFKDFGDSSLLFEVHFWIHMRTIMDGATVRSDVRLAIDEAFRKEGIVIAFPQRDVHLDLESPIEIALTKSRPALKPSPRRAA